ncbi:MAG: hypothetical protein ACKVG4_11925 [Longimicrobiales bacterium]
MVTMSRGQEQSNALDAAPGSVPFVDMLHWPFETALRWQASQGGFDANGGRIELRWDNVVYWVPFTAG